MNLIIKSDSRSNSYCSILNVYAGSPFTIKVEGESILAYTLTSKVEIKGKALTSACKVNEVTTFEVDCQEKSIAAGLRYVVIFI